jgi:hypothetical protein
LIQLHPAGTVAVIATDQNKVTKPKREMGKGWQNSSITTEHVYEKQQSIYYLSS